MNQQMNKHLVERYDPRTDSWHVDERIPPGVGDALIERAQATLPVREEDRVLIGPLPPPVAKIIQLMRQRHRDDPDALDEINDILLSDNRFQRAEHELEIEEGKRARARLVERHIKFLIDHPDIIDDDDSGGDCRWPIRGGIPNRHDYRIRGGIPNRYDYRRS
jgi:hypothetical protein